MTSAKVAEAHAKDLAIQGKHGVRFPSHRVDEKQGKVFCLSEAPNAEASQAAHAEAGHLTKEIYQVREGH